jgi:uncharacterized phage-associated protein
MAISFTYDADRARNAVLWLLKRHGRIDRLKLIKLVFLADRMHLKKYGRPIVGGRYCAMKHGPVSSELLAAVQQGALEGARTVDDVRVEGSADPDEDYLAQSDLEVLQQIDDDFGKLDTWLLRDHTHLFELWKNNFPGGNSSSTIPYEDFFLDADEGEKALLELIRDHSEAESLLR